VRLKNKWIFLLVFLATLLTLYAVHPVYLSALGHLMVVSDPLEKPDAIVVLDGDYPPIIHGGLRGFTKSSGKMWWKHRADSRTFIYEFSKIIWYSIAIRYTCSMYLKTVR
jgi:hypothetical protein